MVDKRTLIPKQIQNELTSENASHKQSCQGHRALGDLLLLLLLLLFNKKRMLGPVLAGSQLLGVVKVSGLASFMVEDSFPGRVLPVKGSK